MKYLKKLLKASVIFLIILAAVVSRVTETVIAAGKSDASFLVCGIDDEAGNADAIIIVKTEPDESRVRILRVPRDTLIEYDGRSARINSVFSLSKASGHSDREALSAFEDFVEAFSGISIDAAFLITSNAMVRIVESVGGVEVEIEKPIAIKRPEGDLLILTAGNNLLYGSDALLYVRHRKSYPDADLGRINAQKQFITALLKRVKTLDAYLYPSLIKAVRETVTMDVDINFLTSLLPFASSIGAENILYYTLPGDPVYINGSWYYRIRRDEAYSLLKSFGAESPLSVGYSSK